METQTMKYLQIHRAVLTIMTLLGCFMLLTPIQSYARDVSFTWTASPEPVTGYKLYYKRGANGTAPYDGVGLNAGDSPIALGKTTTYTITELSPDETYHFTITAYNGEEEGDYSTTITIFSDQTPRPSITNISIK
jgi:hypothetical protein